MRISQDIRDYAKQQGLEDQQAIEKGMREKSDEFKEAGHVIYK
ncbi:hypothetical protein [Paenibacillus alginolyticus]|nr:hypothetical protein [Paenibacillus frigoriresistens]